MVGKELNDVDIGPARSTYLRNKYQKNTCAFRKSD